eukprot:gb/GECG01003951.1/.p1 GENE.gb/GECG01003951.1/~~gb/GECG01003951.1/.p1  ORF type:complete len:963 (+),score=128.33 gb/GECG01003951.1/:1-2889(+)
MTGSDDRSAARSGALTKLQRKVQAKLIETRPRLETFFVAFDEIHRKKVSLSQAARALNMLGVNVTDEDMKELEAYCDANGEFQYQIFSDEMNKVLDAPDEEIDNYTQPLYEKGIHAWGTHSFSEQEQEELEKAMRVCARETHERKLLVKPIFQDFDKNRWGFVPRRVFLRQLLGLYRSMTEHQGKLIEKRYLSDEGTDVNYRAFISDLHEREREFQGDKRTETSPLRNFSPKKDAHGDTSTKFPKQPRTAEDAKQMVLSDFIRRRVNVRDFFIDFDPLNKGICEHSQFQRGLKASGIELGETPHITLSLLADEYLDEASGKVRYADFCDWLESVFHTQGLERAPTVSFDDSAKTRINAALHQGDGLPSRTDETTEKVLKWIRRKVQTERIELVPYFQCFDTTNENCITSAQFQRVLSQLSLLPSEKEELDALLNTYRQRSKIGNHVNWRRFTNDVDKVPQSSSTNILGSSTSMSQGRITPRRGISPEQALHKVKRHVQQNQLRIKDFIGDFDRVHEGLISRQALCSAFSLTGLSLKEEEVEALCRPFESTAAHDSAGNCLIRWSDLVKYIDPIEDSDEVPSIQTLSLQSGRQIESTLRQEGQTRFNESELEQLKVLMQRLSFEVKSQGTIIRPFFQDFDKHRHGTVVPSRFFRACAMLKFDLRPHDHDLLYKAFHTPGKGGDEMSYEWFVSACESDPEMFCDELNETPQGVPLTMDSCARVMEKISARTKPAAKGRQNVPTRQSTQASNKTFERDAKEVLEQLRGLCREKGVLLKEHCRDFDPLRLGRMTKAKFYSALSMACVYLSDADVKTLADAYQADEDSNMVYWHDIVAYVDEHDEHLERDPQGKRRDTQSPSRSATLSPKTTKRTAEEDTEVEKILDYIKSNVVSKRINFKPRFRDFDRLRRNVIHRSKFMMVLDTEPGLRLESHELTKTADAFACSKNEVSYMPFLRRIDPELEQT